MAAGNTIFPYKAKLNFFNATGILGANPANFRLALYSNLFVPDDATDEVLADINNEIAAGNGYTAGGEALTTVTLTQTGEIGRASCRERV